MLISLSVDEILLPMYVNGSTDFWGLPLTAEMAPRLKICFIYVNLQADASYCLRQAM